MNISQRTLDTFIKVLTWIIFIGLCIEAGAILFNFVYSAFRPVAAHNLYKGLDLSSLLAQDPVHYWAIGTLVFSVMALKAQVFYKVITTHQKMDANKPFSPEVAAGIRQISYYALWTGLLGLIAEGYFDRLTKIGLDVDAAGTFLDDSKAMILMAMVVFFIARIFQKGIELQTENDLTV
jgi:hypothetical protein